MNEQKNIIHIRIRDLRREKSLTQEELAEALGISRQSINAMEAGRCLPSLPIALEIASFFAVPIHYLFGENDGIGFSLQPAARTQLQDVFESLRDEPHALVAPTTVPAVNISQNAQEVRIELCLPGYKKENVSLEVGPDFLTVSAEAHAESTHHDAEYVHQEFASQSMTRTIPLPAVVQQDGAEAEMKHGVLHIRLQKFTAEKPRTSKITISSEE